MSFFYDLNKKLDGIRATPEVTHQQLNERDMGKHNNGKTTGFKAVADKAAKEYGSKAAGERVAGAQFQKMKKAGQLEEGPLDAVKKIGKKVAGGINRLVGHGSDEDMIKDLQRKSGAPVTGKKPTPPQQVKEKLSPAKQKSFAALAPPADKITFADKIAGAKKEVDEMLGDVAAEAMRSALSGGQKKLDKNHNGKLDANDFAMLRKGAKSKMAEDQPTHFEVHYKDNQKGRTAKTKVKGSDAKQAKAAWNDWNSSNTPGRFTFVAVKPVATEMDEENDFTAHQRPAVAQPKVGSVERGHKHDIKHTATGRIVTRRVDDQGNSVGADDASDAQAGPRGRGRPKGTKGAIGAKGPSGRSKLMTREGDNESSELKAAMALLKKSGYKVTKAVGEESTHTRDDHAEKAGKKVTKDIEYDEKKKDGITGKKRGPEDDKAEKAGKKVTKDIEHDEKKEKEVDESTTSAGSVATSTATGGKGGVYGKGIYDSMNFELEQMIAESMSINMSDSTEGSKSLTVTATDEDALKLGMMLKNAGLGGGGDAHGGDMHSHEETCPTCGMEDCGCGDIEQAVDENAPDWPTNTEKADNNFGYSGGLNKPKADVAGAGQTTVPNTNVHTQDEDALRRMMEMAGIKQTDLEPWEQTMKEDAEEDATDAENAVNDAEAEEEDVEEGFLESIQRMREIAGIKEGKKPDFLDMDKDGDKKEPMSKAVKDKEEKKVDESIFALTNQWKAYKG